jgi:hypothetical protein
MDMTPLQRRRWTDEDVTKLRSMAQKYPSARIACELGRETSAIRAKAHKLDISLRMDRHQRRTIDLGATELDLT